ncbi:CPBP family intramembrane glutamic endopeptidase [Halobacterium wangiae]|uniref:CPBP family intramembrane glutamic endopeptidase n=1 Tax=Halobacterium wangiae TaxID=2902623 RepID=UPI001E342767|nr:CPBP family intramembrane glutamic endopeptidase [Halobacterium wangiae]
MNDRYAQTVGFVVAGVGLAATFLDWAPVTDVLTTTAAGFAGAAALAFALRRHGSGPDWLDAVAAVAATGLLLASAYAILGITGTLPRGPLLALLAGVAAVAAGAAAVAGLEKAAVRERERRTFVAVVVSIAALVFGSLVAAVVVSFLPEGPLVQVPANTAFASVGYGIAGLVFVRSFGGSLDVSRPGRRDLLIAGGGVVAIFAVHLLLNVVVAAFSLPQSTHSLVETAKAHPEILPPLVVVSLVFIGPGEELLARNGVQQFLGGAYSKHAAIVAASLVFTGSHLLAYAGAGAPPGAVLVTLSRLFLVSLVLGVAYARTDDLFAPIVVHGVYDAVQFALAYALFT